VREKPSPPRTLYILGSVGVAVAAVGVLALALVRTSQSREKAQALSAEAGKGPRVQVVAASPAGGLRRLVFQGEARPYVNATLYAKVSGYLKDVRVDKGDSVKADQVLAVIEAPEIDRQFDAAVADARFKRDNARRVQLLADGGIASVQDAELARSTAEIAEATVASLATQKSYEVLRSPFDGVVTARYADPGALMQNATSAQTSALPVVKVSRIDRLRVVVYIDQRDAAYAHPGDPVEITLFERRGLVLTGKVARLSHELDPQTRMMLTEIDLENPGGQVVPGSFVQVGIQVSAPNLVEIPVEALVLRARAPFVAVVSKDNRVAYRPVKVADDDGQSVRLMDGLAVGERVALNLGDSVLDGAAIQPLEKAAAGAK
jgi:membrane fusion protein (multidrug efflux system)